MKAFEEVSVIPMRHRFTSVDYGGKWGAALFSTLRFIKNQIENTLLIHGEPGTGKTQIATELCKRLKNTETVTFCSHIDLELKRRSRLKLDMQDESLFNEITGEDLLIIDDCKATPSIHTSHFLNRVISKRHCEFRCTLLLVTTEKNNAYCPLTDFPILASDRGLVIECDWASFRK